MYKFLRYSSFVILICAFGCTNKKTLPDLKETYSYVDTKPFGASVAYNIVKNAYPQKDVTLLKTEFDEDYSAVKNNVYISISRNYLIEEKNIRELLSFVVAGNTAFISASHFDTTFFERINCKQQSVDNFFEMFQILQKTKTSFTKEKTLYSDSFNYFYKPFYSSFADINSTYGRALGVNENGDTNMFVYYYGKGKFIFHTEPRAFSNYFLLTKNNYLYMQTVLKMLPKNPDNIYWDNFYNKKNYIRKSQNSGGGSLLAALLKSAALLFAFFAILAIFIFYLLFSSKRKQRIVPVIKPTENSSVAFAEALAGLYLNKKDNKVIADKMITYFNEHIRTKYYFTTNINDETYTENLSRKSGVAFDVTNELANTIRQSNARLKITDEELLNLNSLIEKFIKNKK